MQPGENAIETLESQARLFAEAGSVSIPHFLAGNQAHDLLAHIRGRSDWLEIFKGAEQAYEMPASGFEALDRQKRVELDRLVWEAARKGFQYRYRAIRVPDEAQERQRNADMLNEFALFMSSPDMVERFRLLTGDSRIEFADAQATAYSQGHFLTSHDDGVEGKGRIAAYVLSLTEQWSPDWGGLLIFPEADRVEGYVPAFNTLRIFSVPRPHSVTCVPPFVTETRYSITGWLRGNF